MNLIDSVREAMQQSLEKRREIWGKDKFGTNASSELSASLDEIWRWLKSIKEQCPSLHGISAGGAGAEAQVYIQIYQRKDHIAHLHFVISAVDGRPTILVRMFEGEPKQVAHQAANWMNQHRLY